MLQLAPRPSLGLDFKQLDDQAAAVIAQCTAKGPLDDLTVSEIRHHYVRSRAPLLEPLVPVHSIEAVDAQIDGRRIPITIFWPLGANLTTPQRALIFFHGGGWVLGDLNTYEPLCRRLANELGRAILFVDYRLAPENPFPAAPDDSLAATLWILDNARYLGLDPKDIAIGGDSAGGNLALVTALTLRDLGRGRQLSSQLLIYPCLDLEASAPSHHRLADGYLLTRSLYLWYIRQYLPVEGLYRHWRASPARAINLRHLPPSVIVTAGFDPLSDEGADFAQRLSDYENTCVHLHYPSLIHGFAVMTGAIQAANGALGEITSAFRDLTQPNRQPAILTIQ